MPKGLYLGRESGTQTQVLLNPDDLTTHGLIVGMTGSGKTGLGIVLIEELLRNGVSVLAVDPKGDLGNLLLTFPNLSAAEFAPWVDGRTGATAEGEATKWREGLAGWGLTGADVAALASSRTAAVYTPGSKSGRPLDLLGSLRPPGPKVDEEDRRELAAAFLAGLLGLAGEDADPVKSRAFILLSMCVEALWERGETATIEALLRTASAPPFQTVGALPLDTFFPAKDRQELVLVLNNLLASPSTAAFRVGEPIDIDAWLGGPASAPKLSILALAHLGDAERIFVLATVLSRVKAWMRSQPGSGTLRAVIYIDEIWGFFPPSAEPPTKKPLLTLLKQARAFGIGVVLATQNPVDLDYKGLANCGIWCVGTLQTERDRQRLTEGLRAASGSDAAEALLSQTRKRVFLLHDVHRKGPCLLETRWAMSYLKGPMTKDELARFAPQGAAPSASVPVAAPPPLRAEPADGGGGPPPLSVTWPVKFVAGRGAQVAKPHLYVRYAVAYRSGKARSPESSGVKLFPLDVANPFEVLEGNALDVAPEALLDDAPRSSHYGEVPSWLSAQGGKSAEKAVKERLPEKLAAQLLRDPISGELSARGESPEEFAARVAPLVKPPLALQQKVARKAQELATAEADAKQRSMETWTSMAGAAVDVLGGLFGGKKKSIRVGKVGSTLSKKRQEENADAKVERLRQELADLEGQIAPPSAERFETVDIVPAKTHVDVLGIGLAWVR